MARKTSKLPTRIWSFGSLAPVEEDRERVATCLRLARRYYNKLVEIERERIERFNRIRRHHAPELAQHEELYSEWDDRVEDLIKQIRRQRQRRYQRTRVKSLDIDPAVLEEYLDEAKKHRTRASEDAKPYRKAFNTRLEPARKRYKEETKKRAGGAGPRTKSRINDEVFEEMQNDPSVDPIWLEVTESDRVAQQAGRDARKASGLFHGVYLLVEEAVNRAKKDSSPRPPRFRSHDGGGRLGVQLRARGTIKPTVASLFGSSSTAVRLIPDEKPWKRGKRGIYYTAWVRVGSSGREPVWARFPVKLHRKPPMDAIVKWVWVVVRRVEDQLVYKLQLVLEHESFSESRHPMGDGHGGHVSIGWSQLGDGGVRVANWRGGGMVVPARTMEAFEHVDQLYGHADDALNAAKRICRLTLRGTPFEGFRWDQLKGRRKRLHLRRFAYDAAEHIFGRRGIRTLWGRWKDANPPDLHMPLHYASRWVRRQGHSSQQERLGWWLYCWAQKDRHLSRWAAEKSLQVTRRRDQLFRDTAIELSKKYATLTVDNYSLADLRKLPELKMPGDFEVEQARYNFQHAAPGRFREILTEVMGPRLAPCERPGRTTSSEAEAAE